MSSVANATEIKEKWLLNLEDLLQQVKSWAEPLGWVTRRIEKNMTDPELGKYRAPGMMMQLDFTRALLEPIGHAAPGVEGSVDFYLMPGYDDIARLFFLNDQWEIVYLFNPDSAGSKRREVAIRLTRESFQAVLADMIKHANDQQ